MQVTIVAQGEPLEGCHDREKMPVDPAGFAADQFGHVRVLFLGQHTASGAKAVREFDKGKFGRRPQDKFFAQSGQVHHDDGQHSERFRDVIPVRDRVQAVAGQGGKPQQLRNESPVNRIIVTGQRA